MPKVTDIRPLLNPRDQQPAVYIVDDEPAIGEAIRVLLETEGFRTLCFRTGREFLEIATPTMQGCVLLDLRLPDYSGLEIQKIMAERELSIPIIFLTGYGTIPGSSEAFRTGAFDFLEKPVDRVLLLQRIADALNADELRRTQELQKLAISERFARLSDREKQVLQFVVNGYSSKAMAKEMGISHRTVEVYRGHIMRKMSAETLIELMRAVAPLLDEDGLLR